MTEQPTNQDLMHFITDIRDDISDMKENVLPEISERVRVTNGSVAKINLWRERMTGAGWAFSLCIAFIVIPLLTWAFISISKIPDKINEGIRTALLPYNFTNEKNNISN